MGLVPWARGGLLPLEVALRVHEIISWLIAAVSLTLLISGWLKDPLTPIYMSIQGALRAAHYSTIFFFSQASALEKEPGVLTVTCAQHLVALRAASTQFAALTEVLTGIMKSAKPGRDVKIDSSEFTRPPGMGAPPA